MLLLFLKQASKMIFFHWYWPYRFWRTRARIMASSPHGRRPGWWVQPVIVKSGDDCRQELLAAQLIKAFHDIFQVSHPLPYLLWNKLSRLIATMASMIKTPLDFLYCHDLRARPRRQVWCVRSWRQTTAIPGLLHPNLWLCQSRCFV